MAQGGRVRTFAPATVIMLIALTAVTACTAEDLDAAPTVVPTPTTSGPPDWEDQADAISPLVIGSVAPEPVPVLGSDERYHVAYELTVLNFSPRPAVITAVETLGSGGEVLTSLSEGEVGARTLIVADYSAAQTTAGGGVQIPSGKTALLVLDDVFAARSEVPASVTHRITASFGRAESGEGGIAVLWPDEATQLGGEVGISDAMPIVIAAPLQGDGWFVDNACCTLNAHRNVLLPVGGRINGAERFAIDVSRIDVTRAEQDGFSDAVLVDGDPTRNEDNLAYGAPVLGGRRWDRRGRPRHRPGHPGGDAPARAGLHPGEPRRQLRRAGAGSRPVRGVLPPGTRLARRRGRRHRDEGAGDRAPGQLRQLVGG